MQQNKLHIIIADDDEDDRFVFEQALTETGIPAVLSHATNGLQVLALLHTQPDIIFMDINMPLMDGLSALDQIRKNGILQELPVIIFSSTENPLTIQDAYRRGAKLFLSKPNYYNDYLVILQTLLAGGNDFSDHANTFIRR